MDEGALEKLLWDVAHEVGGAPKHKTKGNAEQSTEKNQVKKKVAELKRR